MADGIAAPGDVRVDRVHAVDYLALLGWLSASCVILAVLLRKPVPKFEPPILAEWLVVAVILSSVVAIAGALELFRLTDRMQALAWRIVRGTIRTFGLMLAAGATTWIAVEAHRIFLLVPALATALILARPPDGRRRWSVFGLTLLASCASWCFVESISYTRFDMLLLGALPTNAFVPLAFAVAVAVTCIDATAAAGTGSKRERITGWCLAVATLLVVSLRTDFLNLDWIYYHRSYYANAATFVRHGHWLLWDVPSQYGFLSELSIALLPGVTTWDSLTLLLAGVAVAQGAGLYALLRFERRGVSNVACSILLAAAATVTPALARWPAGGIVYPQLGLRTMWLDAGLLVVFAIYLARGDERRKRRLRLVGHFIWTVALFWSFELGVWQTVFWLPLVALYAFQPIARARSWALGMRIAAARIAEAVVWPVAFFGLTTAYYVLRLGHAPDWLSYVEFSIAYGGGVNSVEAVWAFGQIWFLAGFLVALAALTLWAVRTRRADAIPVFAGGWLAVWAASSYFAGEPFGIHINGLLPVVLYAMLIATVVLRREGAGFAWIATIRATILPLSVVLVTGLAVGEQWQQFRFAPSQIFDNTSAIAPVLEPEIAGLLDRAGVPAGGLVLLPNRVGWSKTSIGLIMPFRRTTDGRTTELVPWLPISPVGAYNTFVTLASARRAVYLDRYLSTSSDRGWIVAFHESADCREYSPRLKGGPIASSENFSIARCY